MTQLELNFDQARINARNGASVALLNADHRSPHWSDRAFEFVRRYAEINRGREFQCENIRVWAYGNGLDRPEKERAFGGVISRAIHAGIIRKLGIRATSGVTAHNANANYYEAA